MSKPWFKWCRLFVLFLVFSVVFFGCFGLQGTMPEHPSRGRPGEVETFQFVEGRARALIGFRDLPGPAEEALVKHLGGQVHFTYSLIPAISATLPESAINDLQKHPHIIIEPDGKVYAQHNYDDELKNTWGVKRIGAGYVHEQGFKGKGVKVAIMDTGIADHSQLSIAGGENFTDSGTGYNDMNGHGTHVAGTVAAARDGYGVVGVSPEVDLYAVKVLGDAGEGNWSWVIAALQWCVDNGMNITNNSYGSLRYPGTLVRQAFNNAYNAGILHVAAAGNSGYSFGFGGNVSFPARFESVIAVAATDRSDRRASFSSTGPAIELAAPGVRINSTLRNGGYGTMSGTSMASPHVAGVAALVMARGGINDSVRHTLRETADSLGSASHFGYGLVNAAEAAGDPPEPKYMHVGGISMDIREDRIRTFARATVQILDEDRLPVNGATVQGRWSGATSGTASGTTGSDGRVTFTSGNLYRPRFGTTFTFCVTNVAKCYWLYDEDDNVKTCESVSVELRNESFFRT